MKPFNTTRAVFFLVAGVISFQCLIVLVGVVLCGVNLEFLTANKMTCDRDSKLFEILTGALTAALAFAGGMMRTSPGSQQDPPAPKKDQ